MQIPYQTGIVISNEWVGDSGANAATDKMENQDGRFITFWLYEEQHIITRSIF